MESTDLADGLAATLTFCPSAYRGGLRLRTFAVRAEQAPALQIVARTQGSR